MSDTVAMARIEASLPLEPLVESGLDAPPTSQWRRPPLGFDTINGREIGPISRALRWTNDLDDRICESLRDLGLEHADGGTGFGWRDIGWKVPAERQEAARERLLSFLAREPGVPDDTRVSGFIDNPDDLDAEPIGAWDTTIGARRGRGA